MQEVWASLQVGPGSDRPVVFGATRRRRRRDWTVPQMYGMWSRTGSWRVSRPSGATSTCSLVSRITSTSGRTFAGQNE